MRRRPAVARIERRGAHTNSVNNISAYLDSIQIMETVHIGQSQFSSPVVVFCAEPSCECEIYARQLAHAWSAKGYPTYEIDCTKTPKDELLTHLRHYCSEVECNNLQRPLIVITSLMPCDEALAQRLGRLISRLSECNYNFVLTVAPEASQVLSYVQHPVIIHGSDLVVQRAYLSSFTDFISFSQVESAFAYSFGVPQLLRPALEYFNRHPRHDVPIESLYCLRDAVKKHILDGFRDSLISDDKNMRLAMFLLGVGTLEDIDKAVGKSCGDIFASLCDAAPFYNASSFDKTFCCAYLFNHKVLDGVRHELASYAQLEPKITKRCIELLLEHKEYARAIKVASLFCDEQTWLEVALGWPIELINAGEGRVLRDAVLQCEDNAHVFERACAQVALRVIDGKYETAQQELICVPAPLGSRQTEIYYQLIWLMEALKPAAYSSDALQDKYHQNDEHNEKISAVVPMSPYAEKDVKEARDLPSQSVVDGTYELAHALYVHCCVKQHLMRGDIKKAFAELLIQGVPSKIASVTDVLLAIDFTAVQRFASDHVLRAGFVLQERVTEFAEQTDYAFLADRFNAFCIGLDALAGATDQLSELERLTNKLISAGLQLEAAILLVCAAVQSMYESSRLQAYVLLERAAKLSNEAMPFLSLHLYHLQTALDMCMGSNDTKAASLAKIENPTSSTCVEWLLEKAYLKEESKLIVAANRLKKYALPEVMLPLLAVLAKTCGELSSSLVDAMPAAWCNKIDKFTSDRRDMLKKHESDLLLADAKPHELRINVLGELAMYVDGIPVAEASWKRHMAKNLVALLAVTPGHSLTRLQATSALWPDCDYAQARDRLYVTLTAARRAVSIENGGCPFICTGSGRIWLASEYVTIDMDEFAHACHQVFSAEYSNKQLLEEVMNVSAMYTGMVCVMDDVLGLSLAAREDTGKRFIDLCLLGAYAALSEKELSRAEWLADRAYREDDLREDALRVLLEVYVKQGRVADAKGLFTKYARKLSEVTGLSPSCELKRLLQSIFARFNAEEGTDDMNHGCGQISESQKEATENSKLIESTSIKTTSKKKSVEELGTDNKVSDSDKTDQRMRKIRRNPGDKGDGEGLPTAQAS
ncbi:AfsR/SARP family transcriptional regulator [Atopobium minutum]|uniref:AfsR/SARP family transcriptional regulator n=1 Tax=Atopobium minutum TaxID=1381 RepID=UPI00280B2A97|nr:BTAD domain-containing putative transcriptional regulator [Atopobium minutum]